MNRLFIIGNGFDIALGLKTSYQDFYDYYAEQPTEDENILLMKQKIRDGRFETWADLEIGLGKFSEYCPDEQVFLSCLFDIRTNLKDYLSTQEGQFKNASGLNDFIRSPWNYLEPVNYQQIENFLEGLPNTGARDTENIVTLNYTDSIETILWKENPHLANSVFHLHGKISNMVLGVNDESQIANKGFAEKVDFREEFVKPDFNTACMNNKNEAFQEMIYNANLIVLYGTSIGESDKKWWRAIGSRMVEDDDVALIYLPYDKNKDVVNHENYRLRWTRRYYIELFAKLGISAEEMANDELRKRIFIGINKSFLKFSSGQSVLDIM